MVILKFVVESTVPRLMKRFEIEVLPFKICVLLEPLTLNNAPTALLKVMELSDQAESDNKLIIGVPVGFVNAAESKTILAGKNYPFITSLGRKGGSPVAAAIVNSLIKLTAEEK